MGFGGTTNIDLDISCAVDYGEPEITIDDLDFSQSTIKESRKRRSVLSQFQTGDPDEAPTPPPSSIDMFTEMDNVFYEAQEALSQIASELEAKMDEWEANFDAESLAAFEARVSKMTYLKTAIYELHSVATSC